MFYLPIYLDAGLSLADKFSLSGTMLLRGMGTVFMVLVILWGCLSLFKVFSAPEKPVKTPKPEAKSAPAEEKKPAPAPAAEKPAAVPAPAQTDDAAVIAAICAAIEAYRAEEGLSGLPYRVVSFKRKNGRKSWSGGNED